MIAALLSMLPGVSTLVSLLTPARAAALDNLGRLDTPLAAGLAATGKSRSQIFDASGTWVRPTNVSAVYVISVGAGGGSGGLSFGSGTYWSGGGGGGQVCFGWVPVVGNVVVTVGAGGAAGDASPSAGGTGGSSSFGGLITAQGGGGGGPCTSSTLPDGGAGGGVIIGGAINGGNGSATPTSVGGGGGGGKTSGMSGSCPGYGVGAIRAGGASFGGDGVPEGGGGYYYGVGAPCKRTTGPGWVGANGRVVVFWWE